MMTHFGNHATTYDAHAQVQRDVASWCAEWLENTEEQQALELGAGTGLFTRELCRKGFSNLIATDLSAEMIEVGRHNVPGADWRRLDAFAPTALSASRLYSTSLLQWAPPEKRREILRSWRSLISPGGRALISMFVQGSLREFETVLPGFSALCWANESDWVRDFRSAGFRVQRSESWSRSYGYDSPVHAMRAIHGTGAICPGRFSVGDLRRRLRSYEEIFKEGNHVPLTWHALRIEVEPD